MKKTPEELRLAAGFEETLTANDTAPAPLVGLDLAMTLVTIAERLGWEPTGGTKPFPHA